MFLRSWTYFSERHLPHEALLKSDVFSQINGLRARRHLNDFLPRAPARQQQGCAGLAGVAHG
jgi:hypothetical protein